MSGPNAAQLVTTLRDVNDINLSQPWLSLKRVCSSCRVNSIIDITGEHRTNTHRHTHADRQASI